MRRIEIDAEVYAALGERVTGFETPNEVLRRLLGLTAGASAAGPAESPVILGRLMTLIDEGLIAPGDELRHVQARKGLVFDAVVEENGWLRTARGRYRQPSPALRDLVGTQIDGWGRWTHVRSGRTLRQLRAECDARALTQS